MNANNMSRVMMLMVVMTLIAFSLYVGGFSITHLNETISGTKTFTREVSVVPPTLPSSVANKAYVDASVFGGVDGLTLGSGHSLFIDKDGTNLRFRSLTDSGDSHITWTSNASELQPVFDESAIHSTGTLTSLVVSGVTSIGSIPNIETAVSTNASSIIGNNLAAVHLADTQTISGDKTFSGALNVATPSANTHAVSKLYLDGMLQGYDHSKKAAVRVKTTAALPAHTGALGVLTATSNVALGVVNGVTLLVSERILVTENGASNGIYTVTNVGSGSEPWELTRSSDALTIQSGVSVFVLEGTVGSDTLWAVSTDVTIVMETTSILFVQISTIGQVVVVDVGGETSVVRDQIGDTINFRTLRGESGGPLSTVVVGGDVLEFQLDESKLGDTLTLIGDNVSDIGALEVKTANIDSDVAMNVVFGGSLSTMTSGDTNTSLGDSAGVSLTEGSRNTLVGYRAGTAITTGVENVGVGERALESVDTGGWNTGVGTQALLDCKGGNFNIAVGRLALSSLTSGTGNTSVGYIAGASVTVQTNNTHLGYNAGLSSTGYSNIYLGANAGKSETTESGILRITNIDTPNPLIYGELNNGVLKWNALVGTLKSDVKVSSGVVSADTSCLVIEPESGTSDELDTISDGFEGAEVTLLVKDVGDIVIIKNGTGNIRCGRDLILDFDTTISLIHNGTNWLSQQRKVDSVRTVVNSATYQALYIDEVISVTRTATGACTITLPLISGLPTGLAKITIVDEGSNASAFNITISGNGSDTIEGVGNNLINVDAGSVTLNSDGTSKWFQY